MFPTGFTVVAAARSPSLQEYVPPPVAVSVVLVPAQMVVVPLIVGIGLGGTITATVAVPIQPPVVAVTL